MQKIYGYTAESKFNKSIEEQKDIINKHMVSNGNVTSRFGTEKGYVPIEILEDKNIDDVIEKLDINNTFIICSLDILGNSISKILVILNILQNKKVKLHIIDDNITLEHNNALANKIIISLLSVEKSFIKNRTDAAKDTRNKKGIKLGRKEGKKYPSIFDEHKKEIKKLSKLGVSKKRIIDKIKVGSTQSLTNYIKSRNLLGEEIETNKKATKQLKKNEERMHDGMGERYKENIPNDQDYRNSPISPKELDQNHKNITNKDKSNGLLEDSDKIEVVESVKKIFESLI